jgi:hypothetical protein
MPAPTDVDDIEPPGPGGRRPSWWRRAVAAALRTVARGVDGRRRNEPGEYRRLGAEARQAFRDREARRLFRD